MMYPHYYGGSIFGFGLLPFLIVLGVIFLIWAVFARHGDAKDDEMTEQDSAVQILRERYAKGDITKRQFDQMKKDLAE